MENCWPGHPLLLGGSNGDDGTDPHRQGGKTADIEDFWGNLLIQYCPI